MGCKRGQRGQGGQGGQGGQRGQRTLHVHCMRTMFMGFRWTDLVAFTLATRILCVGHLLWWHAFWKSGNLGRWWDRKTDIRKEVCLSYLFFQEELIHPTRTVSLICHNQLGAPIAPCAGCSTNNSSSGWNTALGFRRFSLFSLSRCLVLCFFFLIVSNSILTLVGCVKHTFFTNDTMAETLCQGRTSLPIAALGYLLFIGSLLVIGHFSSLDYRLADV